MKSMFIALHNFKILNSVILFVPVSMVDYLVRFYKTIYVLFHFEDVFKYIVPMGRRSRMPNATDSDVAGIDNSSIVLLFKERCGKFLFCFFAHWDTLIPRRTTIAFNTITSHALVPCFSTHKGFGNFRFYFSRDFSPIKRLGDFSFCVNTPWLPLVPRRYTNSPEFFTPDVFHRFRQLFLVFFRECFNLNHSLMLA